MRAASATARAIIFTGSGRGFCSGFDLSAGPAAFDKAATPPPQPLPELLPVTAAAEQLALGARLFNGLCSRCHGAAAVSGGVLPDLRYLTPAKHAQFEAVVRGSRLRKGMPAFDDAVARSDIEAIQQYLVKRSHDLAAQLSATRP